MMGAGYLMGGVEQALLRQGLRYALGLRLVVVGLSSVVTLMLVPAPEQAVAGFEDDLLPNIAHALEKTKYPGSDLHWKEHEETHHFACQFTADLMPSAILGVEIYHPREHRLVGLSSPGAAPGPRRVRPCRAGPGAPAGPGVPAERRRVSRGRSGASTRCRGGRRGRMRAARSTGAAASAPGGYFESDAVSMESSAR